MRIIYKEERDIEKAPPRAFGVAYAESSRRWNGSFSGHRHAPGESRSDGRLP